tara:strand:- start:444 stop:1034 length:591 start_codon:yes stop_codon:yes gene_type:complete
MEGLAKQARSLKRINKLLDTAHELLETDSIDKITIANLAKLSELKRTSTYKFFPDPDHIKIALIKRYINELNESINAIMTNDSHFDHQLCMTDMVKVIFDYFQNNIPAQKMILQNTVSPPVNSQLLHKLAKSLLKKIENKKSLPNMFNKEGVFLVITQIIISIFSLSAKENERLDEVGFNEANRSSYAYFLSCTTK